MGRQRGVQEEEKTYPGSTDSNIQNKVHGALADRRPGGEVIDTRTSDLMELAPIEKEGNALLFPVVASAIKLNTPGVIAVVRHSNLAPDTAGLVADTAGGFLAMNGAMPNRLAIDLLHEIDLSARGPAAAGPESVPQHPPGRPHALLCALVVGAESQSGFDAGDLADRGSEDVLALEATGCPSTTGATVP